MNFLFKPVDTFSDDEPFILIHGVNQLMVMGSGIALAIKQKWPIVEQEYHTQGCKHLGNFQWVQVGPNQWVVNLFSQQYVKGHPKLSPYEPAANQNAIMSGLMRLMRDPRCHKIPVYMPKIGCDLGGLSWEDVKYDVDTIEFFACIEFNIIDNKLIG